MPHNFEEEDDSNIDPNEEEQKLRRAMYAMLNKIRAFLFDYYQPVADPKEAEFHLSTKNILEQLHKLFPNEVLLTGDIVAAWLTTGGFTFYDFGEMKFEWLLKKK